MPIWLNLFLAKVIGYCVGVACALGIVKAFIYFFSSLWHSSTLSIWSLLLSLAPILPAMIFGWMLGFFAACRFFMAFVPAKCPECGSRAYQLWPGVLVSFQCSACKERITSHPWRIF
jgi:hypothetical protein